jgi:hypothetical protein
MSVGIVEMMGGHIKIAVMVERRVEIVGMIEDV